MGEINSKELLTGLAENYRSQIRMLDLVLEMEKEINDLKKRLKILEERKCCNA